MLGPIGPTGALLETRLAGGYCYKMLTIKYEVRAKETNPVHRAGPYVPHAVVCATAAAEDRTPPTISILGASGEPDPGTSTQELHNPTARILEHTQQRYEGRVC